MVKTLSFYEKNNVSEIKNNINMTQATCINADKYNNFQLGWILFKKKKMFGLTKKC